MNGLDQAIERRAKILVQLPALREELDRVEAFIANWVKFSTDPLPSPTPRASHIPTKRERLLVAFTDEWQRLGDAAAQMGGGHGNKLITVARQLRAEGLLESRYHVGHYQWRLTASGMEARQGGDEVPARSDESAVAESETPKDTHP